jgi:large subunit ribosomal protein L29
MAKASVKFKDMSVEELLDKVDQLRTEMFNLRVSNTTKELNNTAKISQARRELARTLTFLTQKQQA